MAAGPVRALARMLQEITPVVDATVRVNGELEERYGFA
jgi:hypothetical protein